MVGALSGRRAQAARNDGRIVEAARAVFVADPAAPIAAVAEHARVGISALYRRYGSKEDLLARLCADGLAVYIAAAQRALDEMRADQDPWEAFVGFLGRVVEADTHSLTVKLAGRFTPTEEHYRAAAEAGELATAVVDRAHSEGVLRSDIVAGDLGVLFEQLAVVRGADDDRTRELRTRYLELLLDALRTPARHSPLPGPPPAPGEFQGRWRPAAAD
jgi:AcrR family transcriptional regulator